VRALGFSLAWQAAPAISLRAWTLYFNDRTQPYEALVRFGRPVQSGTPGSLWLTYENPSGLRLDGIYRADLLDALPNRHVDASLSALFTTLLSGATLVVPSHPPLRDHLALPSLLARENQ